MFWDGGGKGIGLHTIATDRSVIKVGRTPLRLPLYAESRLKRPGEGKRNGVRPGGSDTPNPLAEKEGCGDNVRSATYLSPPTLGRAKVSSSRLATGRGWAHSPSHVAAIGAWKESEWLEIQEARCDRCR